jgi:hypothetical protein
MGAAMTAVYWIIGRRNKLRSLRLQAEANTPGCELENKIKTDKADGEKDA